jgi:hemoglobin
MTTSLYEQLGKADGIRRLVDDIMAAHLANPLVKSRFEGVEDLAHAKQLAFEFFCAGSGGAEAYTGRDMRQAHRHMNISEQEYLAAMDDFVVAMRKNRIGDDAQKDVIAILFGLKDDIIRV